MHLKFSYPKYLSTISNSSYISSQQYTTTKHLRTNNVDSLNSAACGINTKIKRFQSWLQISIPDIYWSVVGPLQILYAPKYQRIVGCHADQHQEGQRRKRRGVEKRHSGIRVGGRRGRGGWGLSEGAKVDRQLLSNADNHASLTNLQQLQINHISIISLSETTEKELNNDSLG